MPSSTTSILPDVNVWLALAYAGHEDHAKAREWFEQVDGLETVVFCRVTQMSLLRLLTNKAVMGESCQTQLQAWRVFDALLEDSRIGMMPEPSLLDQAFRQASARNSPSLRLWTDDYLVAFAKASGLTLVTLDRALAERLPGSLLL